MNCWHASSLYAAQVFATNGQTYAIDASGTGYSYADYPTNSWTAHPEWGVVYGLQYGGDGNLYSLYGPGGGACINQGQHSVGRWNGPGWTQLTYCMGSFSVAADGGGQMLAIDGNGTLWIATNYGNSAWVHAAIPGFPVIAATSINSNLGTYAVILHDNTIWAYNGSSWSQLTSNGRAKQITADSLGTLYVIGMDNNVYHYNGSGWDRLNGGGNTFLANGGSMEVWAIGPASGGNSVYRFSDTGLQHTRMVSGSSTCNGNLCPLASHSATVKAGWGSKYGSPGSVQGQSPNGSLSVQSSVDLNDVFLCLENDSACQPTTQGSVNCTIAGQMFTDVEDDTIDYEWATTQVTWFIKDTPICLSHFCRYKVSWSCIQNPPDYQIGTVQSSDVYFEKYKTASWQSKAFCWRFPGTTWSCFAPPVIGDPVTWVVALDIVPPPFACTYNP